MSADPTTDRILATALEVFGELGFDGLRMRAVARRAGVSHPTLYARFRNKEELFRGVIRMVFDSAIASVAAAVDAGGPLADVLERVLCCYYGDLYDQVLALDRGDEIVAAQRLVAADIVVDTRARMRRQLSRALRGHASTSSPRVPRTELVRLLMQAPSAFKGPDTTGASYRRQLRTLARVVAASVSPADA